MATMLSRWPIRAKLMIGLGLVIGIVLILLAGSMYGLRGFHEANLTLTDQLRELGASKNLLEQVVRLDDRLVDDPQHRLEMIAHVTEARDALQAYYLQLRANSSRGKRTDDGTDELEIAFWIDIDLTALLTVLDPERTIAPVLPGTSRFLKGRENHWETSRELSVEEAEFARAVSDPATERKARIDRLNTRVMQLPVILFQDFYFILQQSQTRYHSSRIIIWISAAMVLVILIALTILFQRWVLDPIRILQRGVRRVARGSFGSKIVIESGDEMQALAEAFNEMTSRIQCTYQDLERQVQDRSRQLLRSEQLASVGFLAAGVAHEINNPLASIALCSEALEARMSQLLRTADIRVPEDQTKILASYTRMIQEEAFRCKKITEKLLDFARRSDLSREPTDLGDLIEGVVEMIQHMGKYRGKRIVFEPMQSVTAEVDSQEIKQVVLNLVVNALESLESGGELRITLRPQGAMAEMAFADDGHGMPADVLDNIFEPFFTTRPQGKGTGLGLSITHRIITQHQGEIFAQSQGPGHGATFIVRLPIRSDGSEEDSQLPSRAKPIRAA